MNNPFYDAFLSYDELIWCAFYMLVLVQCTPSSYETGCFPYFLFLLYFAAETALILTNIFLSIERKMYYIPTYNSLIVRFYCNPNPEIVFTYLNLCFITNYKFRNFLPAVVEYLLFWPVILNPLSYRNMWLLFVKSLW